MKSEINENYLWEKSESDAEIEKLENLLQGFALQEFEAPILPQKTFDLQPKTSKFRLYFPFAFAASLLLVVLLGVWFLNFNKQIISDEFAKQNDELKPLQSVLETEKTTPKLLQTTLEQKSNTLKDINNGKKTLNSSSKQKISVKKTLNYDIKQEKSGEKVSGIVEKAIYPSGKLLKTEGKVQKDNAKIVLTPEEIKAYETLKLALSITGDKLKIVKEKIDNTEENSADLKQKSTK